MGRASKVIPVTLAPAETRIMKQLLRSGSFQSEGDVLRQGLHALSHSKQNRGRKEISLKQQLEAGYRATAKLDNRFAAEWGELADSWPEK